MHEEAAQGVRDQIRAHGDGMEGEVHVGCTTPIRGILGAVEQFETDLLVMGTVCRGGVPGFLIGNTAETVLPKSHCSLLVVKPADFISPISLEVPTSVAEGRANLGVGGAAPAPA